MGRWVNGWSGGGKGRQGRCCRDTALEEEAEEEDEEGGGGKEEEEGVGLL